MLYDLFTANSWAPMQHIVILGLESLEDTRTSSLALKWAERWVQSNYIAFEQTGAMYEKYIATEFGGFGGGNSLIFVHFQKSYLFLHSCFYHNKGGEYEVQKGFGWTNGVVLDFLNRYGSTIRSPGWKMNYIRQNFP